MKFNHLNVPNQWEHYWTRYPEGYTILEALISWVSQVDDMIDNQNKLNASVEQFRNELDEFIGRFDERLQDEVTHTLKEWEKTGFLDVVISEALQWQLDNYITTNEQDKFSIFTQLSQKADKNVVRTKATPIGLDDLDSEALGVIQNGTGGTPVDVLSIPRDGSVTPEKTDFAKRYKNLFDGNYVTNAIIGGDSSTGHKYVTYSGGISLIVEIEPSQTYTISRSVDTDRFGVGVFEGNPNVVINAKRMLNTAMNNTLETFTFTAGATETHLMVYLSATNETPAWVQIEKGSFATEYVGYDKLEIDLAIKNSNIVEPIRKENTTVVEKYNLLDKSTYIDEKILNSSGNLLDFPDYSTSTKQFIGKGSYFVSAHRRLVTFTTSGTFIKEYDNVAHSDVTVDIPEDCFYQISCRDEHWSDLRVVRKDYGQLPDNTMLLARDIFIPQQSQAGYNQRFNGKNMIFFGDSILRNYPDDGSIPFMVGERLGCDVTNVGIGGTKIAYVAGDNNTPLSGSRLLEAKINNDLSEQFTVADTQAGVQKERTLSSLNALDSNRLNFYDYGVIAFSTNDFLQSIPEGTFNKDRSTLKGAYSYFIENLLTVAPNMKLLLVSPAYQWRPDDLSFNIDTFTNDAGLKLSDIVRVIKEVSDYYKLEFLDNFNNAGLNDFNREYYFPTNDGIHPLVSTGIPILANRIAGKLEDSF